MINKYCRQAVFVLSYGLLLFLFIINHREIVELRGTLYRSEVRELDWVFVQHDDNHFEYDLLLPSGKTIHARFNPLEPEPEFGTGEILETLQFIPLHDCWSQRGIEPAYLIYREGEDKHVAHTTEAAYRADARTIQRQSGTSTR